MTIRSTSNMEKSKFSMLHIEYQESMRTDPESVEFKNLNCVKV